MSGEIGEEVEIEDFSPLKRKEKEGRTFFFGIYYREMNSSTCEARSVQQGLCAFVGALLNPLNWK